MHPRARETHRYGYEVVFNGNTKRGHVTAKSLDAAITAAVMATPGAAEARRKDENSVEGEVQICTSRRPCGMVDGC